MLEGVSMTIVEKDISGESYSTHNFRCHYLQTTNKGVSMKVIELIKIAGWVYCFLIAGTMLVCSFMSIIFDKEYAFGIFTCVLSVFIFLGADAFFGINPFDVIRKIRIVNLKK
jgi:hypothetical protein